MVGIHAGHGAGDDYGARFVACFMQAADDVHLPDDPDLRAALRSYMEWATRMCCRTRLKARRCLTSLPVPEVVLGRSRGTGPMAVDGRPDRGRQAS